MINEATLWLLKASETGFQSAKPFVELLRFGFAFDGKLLCEFVIE